VRVQTAVTASKGQQRGDVQIKGYLQHNGAPRDLVFHPRALGGPRTIRPRQARPASSAIPCFDTRVLSHGWVLSHAFPDINKPLREAAKEKDNKYQHTYAKNHSISFLPATFISTSGRIDAEFLRLLRLHAHRESEEFFRLTGQLAQPNQDYVLSKRAAFFNGLKSKIGHIMAKATALRVNLNLAPSIPPTPRPSTRKPLPPRPPPHGA